MRTFCNILKGVCWIENCGTNRSSLLILKNTASRSLNSSTTNQIVIFQDLNSETSLASPGGYSLH